MQCFVYPRRRSAERVKVRAMVVAIGDKINGGRHGGSYSLACPQLRTYPVILGTPTQALCYRHPHYFNMDKLSELIDVQASRDESTNTLLTLSLDVIAMLRVHLFEEARSLSLTESCDVLINRKGSALRPKSFAMVSDILTLAASIQDCNKVPRTVLKTGNALYRTSVHGDPLISAEKRLKLVQ